MKRKADAQAAGHKPTKKKTETKKSLGSDEAQSRFRKGLFDKKVLDEYTAGYARSEPYKHAVIHELIDDRLLRAVRDEIKDNVSFTPKETDIYKIHQSGDLANLDGLDDEALSKLPSLLALRDGMYSQSFRDYVSHITGCGPLSGRKTDMAINVYTPGCYLLCHDDVIGSRKVSYILYLTDPDIPWKPEWGGALRLFPVHTQEGKDGESAKTPAPDHSKVIPPAWNQLSFFAVQPGESFHDVEEVYHAESAKQLEREGGRIRMAISGWFHIPQAGEDGYVPGAEEAALKNSGLMQLQGNPDQHDLPRSRPVAVENPKSPSQEEFSEDDLEFLLKFMAPTYLVPDTIEQIKETFEVEWTITLADILGKKFAQRLRDYVTEQESTPLPESSDDIEKERGWTVARPPHKHRFAYLQPSPAAENGKTKQKGPNADSPIRELLEEYLPSPQFRRWLQMATNTVIESHDYLARRFRRGKDYTLATGYDGKARLELNLGMTPTGGWGDEVDDDEGEGEGDEEEEEEVEEKKAAPKSAKSAKTNGQDKKGGKAKKKNKVEVPPEPEPADAEIEVGGHEVYMAGDDDAAEDAAVYKAGGSDDDEILFFQAAAWNKLSIVLRDSGTLKFVKYISQKAQGDRWDISGTFDIEDEEDGVVDSSESEGGDEDDQGEWSEGAENEEDAEEEWNGIAD